MVKNYEVWMPDVFPAISVGGFKDLTRAERYAEACKTAMGENSTIEIWKDGKKVKGI